MAVIGDQRSVAYGLSFGGVLALDTGDHELAATYLSTSIHARLENVGREHLAADLTVLAQAVSVSGDLRRAAALLGAADALVVATGEVMPARIRSRHDDTSRKLRRALGDGEFRAAFETGRSAPDRHVMEAAAGHADDVDALIGYAEAELRRAG